MTCLNFGTRAYDVRDNLGNSHGRWNNSDGDFAYWYNQTPNYTAKTRGSGSMSDDAWKDSGDSENGDCSVPNNTHLGTKFIPCGDCLGGSHWRFCQCCVSNWNPTNKSECCDPTPNNKQNDAIECDVEWCPFSVACENADSTGNYCLNNVDDPKCLQICNKYLAPANVKDKSRPEWCDGFINKYCSINGMTSATSLNLCACMFHHTDADECIWSGCSSGSGVWMSASQVERVANCGTICEQNINAVNDGTVNIDKNEFIINCHGSNGKFCAPNSSGEVVCVTTNSSGGGGGDGDGDGISGVGGNTTVNGLDSNGNQFANWWGSNVVKTNQDGTVSHSLEFSNMGWISIATFGLLVIVIIAIIYMHSEQNKLIEMIQSNATSK